MTKPLKNYSVHFDRDLTVTVAKASRITTVLLFDLKHLVDPKGHSKHSFSGHLTAPCSEIGPLQLFAVKLNRRNTI
jgi:hypothetical protein